MKTIYLENTNGHSKFYRMTEISASEWVAEYGKIGNSPQRTTYSMSEWNTKYREKIRKGYKEVSQFTTNTSQKINQDIILEKLNKLKDLIQSKDESEVIVSGLRDKRVDLKKINNLIYKHQNLDTLSKSELIELNKIYKIYKGI